MSKFVILLALVCLAVVSVYGQNDTTPEPAAGNGTEAPDAPMTTAESAGVHHAISIATLLVALSPAFLLLFVH